MTHFHTPRAFYCFPSLHTNAPQYGLDVFPQLPSSPLVPTFEPSLYRSTSLPSSIDVPRRRLRGPGNFLFKLWTYLRDNPNSTAIFWDIEGRVLVIPDEQRMIDELVTELKLFDQKNYHSFARQLNMYGFKRTHMQQYLGSLVQRHGGEAKFWIHETLNRSSTYSDLAGIDRIAAQKKRRSTKKRLTSYSSASPSQFDTPLENPSPMQVSRKYDNSPCDYFTPVSSAPRWSLYSGQDEQQWHERPYYSRFVTA